MINTLLLLINVNVIIVINVNVINVNESTHLWEWQSIQTAAHLPYDCNNNHKHTNTMLTLICREEISSEWYGLVRNARMWGAVSLQQEGQLWQGPGILAG